MPQELKFTNRDARHADWDATVYPGSIGVQRQRVVGRHRRSGRYGMFLRGPFDARCAAERGASAPRMQRGASDTSTGRVLDPLYRDTLRALRAKIRRERRGALKRRTP